MCHVASLAVNYICLGFDDELYPYLEDTKTRGVLCIHHLFYKIIFQFDSNSKKLCSICLLCDSSFVVRLAECHEFRHVEDIQVTFIII